MRGGLIIQPRPRPQGPTFIFAFVGPGLPKISTVVGVSMVCILSPLQCPVVAWGGGGGGGGAYMYACKCLHFQMRV